MNLYDVNEGLQRVVDVVLESGFVIGSKGLERPQSGITLQPNTVYYMGASTSPARIIVTKVSPDRIEYVSGPDYKHVSHMERWVAADLITRGTKMWLKKWGSTSYPWAKRLTKSLSSMMKGGKGQTVRVSDFHRVEVTAEPVSGTVDSLWRDAEMYGNVGGSSGNFIIDMKQGEVANLKRDSRFKVLKVRKL